MKGYKGFHWSLTSLQLSIAIILIIWAFMIFEQVQYVLSKDLGFSKANLVTIDAPIFETENFEADLEVFKNKLRPLTVIQDITSSSTVMGDAVWGINVRRNSIEKFLALDTNGGVDENFIPFYNIKILTGRNFNESDQGNSIIISEGALSRLGFNSADEAGGSIIEFSANLIEEDEWKDVTIIGVMKSYRLRPMLKFSGDHDAKEDAGIALTRHYLNSDLQPERITLRIDAEDTESTLRTIEHIYTEIFPGNVFHWYFLDEHINRHYRSEKIWRNQILFFTCLAIGIACLGMLGMISLKAVEKTKEIGIRKVLGAQLHHIAKVLLSTTMKQIIIATVVGIPVAYYLTQQYLEKYSVRITLQWWHFAIPILILVSIMFLSISTVLWKAARNNPVEALKNE
jgi:putative ABC transport system permease protein